MIAPIVQYFQAALPAGLTLLRSVTATGTHRKLAGKPQFNDNGTLLALANHFATVLTISDLIGRYRINNLAQRRGYNTFAEGDIVPWTPEELAAIFTPRDAIDYFRMIMPIDFPEPLFTDLITGRAFSLAVSTDQIIEKKVSRVILDRIETGKQIRQAGPDIEEILDDSGISHPNGYGDLVWRTNILESYRHGAWGRVTTPEMLAFFIAWMYIGIDDGRERLGPEPDKPDHHRNFRKYWPLSISFFDVRGTDIRDVARCRCDFAPLDRRDWLKAQAGGAVLETTIPYHAA